MARLFGTDGVRGIANKDLTAELAFYLGAAGSSVLAKTAHHKPVILVGTDTRLSKDMLESALCAGICATGATALSVGVIPTPAIAHLTRLYEADAGVMISASHNSFEFNGIKFFSNQGYKLSDDTEDEIEALIKKMKSDPAAADFPVGESLGTCKKCDSAAEDYLKYLLGASEVRFEGYRFVLDCANGASSYFSPELFKRLGAEVIAINNTPDGININRKCGSTHMEMLKEKVVECKADAGFAFDGDADRLLAVDEEGNLVDGDAVMAILGLYLRKKGLLVKDTIVATKMSNLGLEIFTRENGMSLVRTDVGDRYVLEEMLRSGYMIGGEQSGHVILLHNNTTGDGLLTALKVATVMAVEKKSLKELASVYRSYPQVLVNAKVRNDLKYKYMEDEDIAKMCQDIEDEFQGKGRVVIRPSGTEPLVRVMIEGENYDYLKGRAELLAALIESRLGT